MPEPEEFVICRVCGKHFDRIQHSHLKKHNMSMAEYREKYPTAILVSGKLQKRINDGLRNREPKVIKPRVDLEDYVVCHVCGKKQKILGSQHFTSKRCMEEQKKKSILIRTIQDYRTHFPGSARVCTKTSLRISTWQRGRTFPESHRRAISRGNMGRVVTAETRKKISSANKGRNRGLTWEEIYGDKKAGAMKKAFSDARMGHIVSVGTRKKISEAQKGKPCPNRGKYIRRQDDKRRLSMRMRDYWAGLSGDDYESLCKRMGQSQKRYWMGLTEDERHTRLRLLARQPNKEELRLSRVLEPLGFRYVGNKRAFVGGHNPDYIHNKLRIVVEYDGYGAHDPNLPWVSDNILELDGIRNSDYEKEGYFVLCLYPEDLRITAEEVVSRLPPLFQKWFMEAIRRAPK